MEGKSLFTNVSAARAVASIFGILSGLGGLTHGIGETLQGNVAPEGIVINSWTQGPIATYMGGEPALTIVVSLVVIGLFVNSFFFAVLSLPLAIFTGIAYDIQNSERGAVVQ